MTTKKIQDGQTKQVTLSLQSSDTLAILSGGTGVVGTAINDAGLISIAAAQGAVGPGTLSVASGGALTVSGGAVGSVVGGQVLDAGLLTNAALLTIGAGTAVLSGSGAGGAGGLVSVTGSLSNTGTIDILGGRAGGVAGGSSLAGVLDVAGVLTNLGTLIAEAGGQGAYYAQGGTIDVTGVLINQSVLDLNAGGMAHGGASLTVAQGGSLTNAGTLSLQANGSAFGASAAIDGILLNTGTLVVDGSQRSSYPGAVTVAGTMQNYGGIELTGSLVIESGGTLVQSAAGTLSGTGTFSNDGTVDAAGVIAPTGLLNLGLIEVGSGELIVRSAVTDTAPGVGTFAVSAGATLNLQGAVSGYETVSLGGPGALAMVTTQSASLAVQSSLGGTLEILGGGGALLNAGDTNLVVTLAQPTELGLSEMAFVTAQGSSGSDTITAGSVGQTLTGGLGADLLIGSMASGDTFLDTAAGLNGDTLDSFLGSDVIDVTNIAAAGSTLAYVPQSGGRGVLTVSGSGTMTAITLVGSFTASSFSSTSDGHSGVLITLHK